jgi:hypothetical protein
LIESEDGASFHKAGLVLGSWREPETVRRDPECLRAAGKIVPVEDPNAEPPRSDGSPYTVADVVKLAVVGRSKWKGRTLRVTGAPKEYSESDTMSSMLLHDVVDDKLSIGCVLDAPIPHTTGPVIVEGTVGIVDTSLDDGTPTVKAELVKCSVVKS